ncbi:hypothetical protein [Lysobacter hankyongensis]|uniref:Nucleoside diphosphate kinase-like domain-containing protein n=1 Tax=Lysobacter hankyongensis TaxID=1176535 RepID=A0ABP9B1Q8_9GAMM
MINSQDALPDDAQWRTLTASPEKRALFGQDLYFREAWADARAVLHGDPAASLSAFALLCAKPDAVAGRRLRPMLDYAIERGFAPVGVAGFAFGRHSMREIWRYDWHVYTVDRLRFSTLWYTSAPSLMFVLEDRSPEPGIPASVRLTSLKGNALASKRGPDDLRSRLAPPNQVLNFVHVTDEPADLIRELGILLESGARRDVLRWIRDRPDGAMDAAAAIEALYASHAAHDLDPRASLRRLRDAGAIEDDAARRLEACLSAEEIVDWETLCALAPSHASADHRWDFISIASAVVPRERPLEGLLRNPDIHDWRRLRQAHA